MKVLFIGGYLGNSGPENVNKKLIEAFDKDIRYIHSGNKVVKYLELIKIFTSDVVVLSGLSKIAVYAIRIAKVLNKKIVYLMHGCVEYESGINGFKNVNEPIAQEHFIMDNSDMILAVSEKYSKWLKKQYKQYANKIHYLNNGVEYTDIQTKPQNRVTGRVVAIGGDRKIKNNVPVAKAIAKLDKGEFFVFGTINFPESVLCEPRTKYIGQVSQDELHEEMAKADLFVLNSVFETFSLAAIEALQCGCSILLSEIAGITSILKLEESDIIKDPTDINEIAQKIDYLLDHPNRDRIYSQINWSELSYEVRVQELKDILLQMKGM